jgi:phosphotriesterase-related protein
MKKIRTVTGDVPAEKMGRTLTHEHLLYTYPGGEHDHNSAFDLDNAVNRIATELKAGMDEYHYGTIVDMTPAEVGRNPELMKRVSQKTGANVIAVSGFFPERMGIPYWFRRQTVEELADFYVRDLTEGMVFAGTKTGIKAGAIKIATGQESVEPKPSPIGPNGRRIHQYEDRLIRAAGRAQKATGCCINTHTDPMDYTVTNPGIEQLDIIEEEGGDPTKVIIGHAFVEPQGLHQIVEILERGATVQVDHIGIPWRHPDASQLDESMANMMCELADQGYIDQMVITYDRWFFNPRGAATEENPQLLNEKVNLGYLFTKFAPRLRGKGFKDADLEKMLVDNPRRILPMDSLH